MDFKELIKTLSKINVDLRDQAARAVNISLTLRNWFFGFYLLEFEQKGKDRAEYGKALLATIAEEMKAQGIPNANERELRKYRQFYSVYSHAGESIIEAAGIRKSLSPELIGDNYLMQIRASLNPEFIDEKYLIRIRASAKPEFGLDEQSIIPNSHYQALFTTISYSHFKELIRIDDPLKRLFYEIEIIKNTWSVAELKRQIGSLLYERTGLSKNKKKLLASLNTKDQQFQTHDIIRDPYVFEFLGLKPQEVFYEKELEQALLDNLLQFILELGKGFCFEARQKRILIDNEHHYIDLVFYHRILHCHILIDLKTERFHYTHAGQMNMYLEYFKKYEMAAGDNPPVGILLCTDKDDEHVEFATAGLDDKLFVSKYLVALPGKKQLEQFIKKELRKNT